MKKLCLFLVLTLFLSGNVYGAENLTDNQENFPHYGETESFGRGNWSADVHGGAICYDKEGNPLLCFGIQGGHFYVVDITTGEVKHDYFYDAGYIYSNVIVTAADGKVYTNGYPAKQFKVYDPIADTFESLEINLDDGTPLAHAILQGAFVTDDGKIFIGNFRNEGAEVFEYDIYTQNVINHGVVWEKGAYIKALSATDKYIYCGMGTGPEVARIIRIDRKTGEKTHFLENPGGGIIYSMNLENGVFTAVTFGNISIVDENTLERTAIVRNSGGNRVSMRSPYNKNIFYHSDGESTYVSDGLFEYDMESKQDKKVADYPFDGEGLMICPWAELPNGDWVLPVMTSKVSGIGYYNPKTGEMKAFETSQIPDAGPQIQSMEISPDNIIYIGGYQSSMGVYDIDGERFLYSLPTWEQNEGVGFLNGKTYFGVYTDATVWRYDPEKPINFKKYLFTREYQGDEYNPAMVYDIQDDQDRPFVLKGYKNKLYVGTFPGYSQFGGTLTIYEEDENGQPSAKVFRHVVPNEAINGVAVKDNLVYLSGSIKPGLGVKPIETEAHISVFDTNTETVIDTFTPDLPSVGTSSPSIGELSFGPDGLLWGVSEKDGLVFAMNPETYEVEKYVVTAPGFDRGGLARPLYLRWGDDGLLYTTAGWNVSVIDPETMEFKKLTQNCSLMTLDYDGNVWYAKGGGFTRIKINQYDRLTRFLKTLSKLKAEDYETEERQRLQSEISKAQEYDENTAEDEIIKTIRAIKKLRDRIPDREFNNAASVIVNGKEIEFNEKTGSVINYNNRTMVPYQTFFETLGYEMEWNVHKNLITAKKENAEIKITVNKNDFEIDGRTLKSDTPPVLLYYRHYIPLRAIAESMGYRVSYDEKTNSVLLDETAK